MGGAGAKESSMPWTETLLTEETLAKASKEAAVGRDGTEGMVWGSGGLGAACQGRLNVGSLVLHPERKDIRRQRSTHGVGQGV